jgi:pilus assembly protein Flp/PilA
MFDKMFITLQILRGDFAARFDNEEGATAVEYGLLVALIALVMAVGATFLGNSLSALFTRIGTQLGGIVGG